MAISITDKAATKVQDYLKQVNDQNLALRVFVKAGGCAGYQFGLKLDKTGAADVIEHRNGVNIVADAKSADLLGDAEIDYVETEMGGGFKFNFLKATSHAAADTASYRKAKNRLPGLAVPKSTTPTTKPPLTFPGQLAQSTVRGYATQKQATAYIHGDKLYDIDKVRHDFPILNRLINGKPLAYLDSAATAQKPVEVIDELTRFYNEYNANVHRGVYKISEEATAAYEEARAKIARLINAKSPNEIIFVRGTTEAINLVAQSWGRANVGLGDGIILTEMEHHSNIVPWQLLAKERGAHLQYVGLTDDGHVVHEDFRQHLESGGIKLVTLTHVSNVLGTINPVREYIREAHKQGCPVLVDAAQSVPHMPVDVQDLDCDFLAFSGHKMCGTTGI